jgi:hypothetical protein
VDTSKIRLTLVNGREHDFEGHFALPADRIELERRFNVSTNSLGSAEAREEWILFLVWRSAVRSVPEMVGQSFDDFLQTLGSYEFVGGDASTNPTEPAAPIG